ncbi:CAP domain-containing protein [Kitasatospora sp. NPDC101183]|uniref:CAP domain-containing protein n=1 Tax=Kitasatospora sp. NPDC101183 TaxID=3364100 RepID=UPI00381E4288
MNSDDKTTVLPAVGGRASRRAARRHGGGGRRGRRRGGLLPVTAVVAAVAGTGLLAALTGAGYAAFGGKQTDRDAAGQSIAADNLIAAEVGTHDGIQVPGTGALGSVAPVVPTGPGTTATPSATAPASPTASATPTPTASATTAPASASARPSATAAKAGGAGAAQRAASGAPAAPAGGGASPGFAQQVLDLVNVERSKAGCGPVTADSRLAGAAQSHSDDMADRNYFDHASPEGEHADHRIEAVGYRWSTWGENIARGQKDPAAVMDAWMNSPGHRANILNCAFKQLGVGVRTGSGGPWWTQVFATPS